jgi:histidine triad (HIT) family protein
MPHYDENNVFAKILRGEIPCKKVFENGHVLAFHDIAPKAPVHILLIPKGPYVSIDHFGVAASAAEIKAFFEALAGITKDLGLNETGFRTIANTGADGCQEVPHFHVHILGGRVIGPLVVTA